MVVEIRIVMEVCLKVTGIEANLRRVQALITEAAGRAGRDPQEVQVVAVSKTVAPARIQEALAAGLNCFGENRVQELLTKQAKLGGPVRWQMIGRLQTNKVRQLLGKVELIHSLDRLALAEEIQRRAGEMGVTVDVLVQVNLAGEASKSGLREDEVVPFLRIMSGMRQIRVQGLMTMAPLGDEPEQARPVFRGLRLLAERVGKMNIAGVEMRCLSMGMSNDFPVAVEEGANMVRIGGMIFGPRQA